MDAATLAPLVVAWLGIKDDSKDAQHAATVAAAVVDHVEAMPSIDRDAAGDWTDGTRLGAVMLAARLVRRRNSPAGVESFTADAPAYVRNEDPDVARLLRLGVHRPPMIG